MTFCILNDLLPEAYFKINLIVNNLGTKLTHIPNILKKALIKILFSKLCNQLKCKGEFYQIFKQLF